MFEEEIQLEKESKSLSFKSPFLYIFLLLLLVIAGIGYAIFKSEKDLTPDQAKPVIESALKARGPAKVLFSIGTLQPSVNEKVSDPHYRLLEKLGFLTAKKNKDNSVTVSLTPVGEDVFAKLPEFKKSPKGDGVQALEVPLATRELVAVKSVTMTSPGNARVTYEWKWATNRVGEQFDASSDIMQKFTQWDRINLINHYGVDFYKQTKTETVNMVRGKKGWKLAEE